MRKMLWIAVGLLASCAAHGAELNVSWTPAMTYNDGSAFTDLAGYRILWKYSNEREYTKIETVNDPGATRYKLTGVDTELPTCVAMVSVNQAGAESDIAAASSCVRASDTAPLPTTVQIEATRPS